jgi:hypothetical protein
MQPLFFLTLLANKDSSEQPIVDSEEPINKAKREQTCKAQDNWMASFKVQTIQ